MLHMWYMCNCVYKVNLRYMWITCVVVRHLPVFITFFLKGVQIITTIVTIIDHDSDNSSIEFICYSVYTTPCLCNFWTLINSNYCTLLLVSPWMLGLCNEGMWVTLSYIVTVPLTRACCVCAGTVLTCSLVLMILVLSRHGCYVCGCVCVWVHVC